MDGGHSDASTHKRPRLDSVNPPVYSNGLPPPGPPHQPHSHPHFQRHPPPTSPPPTRHYTPHGLPPPNHSYPPSGPSPGPGRYPPPQPSPSLPPSDIRTFSDPRNLPSPGPRTHGGTAPPVTLPARPSPIVQDRLADYPRAAQTPRSTALDSQSSRSTSVDWKPNPVMENGHQAQWPVHSDHRPNGSLSNGYPSGASPPVLHEHQFQPPSIPPGQHYGTPTAGYPPVAYIDSPAGYAGQQRRKQVRATQACNHCRARKQKCDEARPCQFCRENNFDCQYKDVPPPKQDRTMMQLQDSVNSLSEQQKSLTDTIQRFLSGFDQWKGSVESRLIPGRVNDPMAMASSHGSPDQSYAMRGSLSDQSGPIQGRSQIRRVGSMKTESPIVPHSAISPRPAQSLTPIKQEAMLATPQPPATPAESVRTDNTNQMVEYGKERIGLKSDHTTPAHLLLEKWTSMASFSKGVHQLDRLRRENRDISDYVMDLEQNRGLIRVWGVGEGNDPSDGAPSTPTPGEHAVGVMSPATLPGASVLVQDKLWGPLEASSPSTLSVSSPQDSNMERHPGGLASDGSLKIDPVTVESLYTSYIKNIHNLHPFLNPSKLKSMTQNFAEMYGLSRNRNLHAGVKRKRSTSHYSDPFSPGGGTTSEFIEKSLHNAIVLLVLALGKVAAYKDKLPSPDPDKGVFRDAVRGSTHGSPSSANNSFSSDSGTYLLQRNIDKLPGMAYFSYATDILGNHVGGNTVAHAQANLLAALYVAQYARVLESWSWINCACRICLVLIKADMSKIHRRELLGDSQQPLPKLSRKEEYRLNLVKCVYWTCLQLETDILAEMSTLPPSEISKYQDEIAYPTGVFEKLPERETFEMTDDDADMWVYSSQIHLRVILNGAHNTLYNSDNEQLSKKNGNIDARNLQDVAKTARVHADILLSWRRMLPPRLAWHDDDPPATDINIARLRAKFYGGHYMILRPFLHLAVHELDFPPDFPLHSRSHNSSPAASGESIGTIMDLSTDQSGVLTVAGHCINSAIQSTIAFDRVGADPNSPYRLYEYDFQSRFTVTNIFGTLHAQFGNMLVLAAVYQSRLGTRYLHNYTEKLTKTNLSLLFRRTIKVLEAFEYNSPVLKVDMDILRNVQRIIGL